MYSVQVVSTIPSLSWLSPQTPASMEMTRYIFQGEGGDKKPLSAWVTVCLLLSGQLKVMMTFSNTRLSRYLSWGQQCNLLLRVLLDLQQELVEINWILFVNFPVKGIDPVNIICGRRDIMAMIPYCWEYSRRRGKERNWEKFGKKRQRC